MPMVPLGHGEQQPLARLVGKQTNRKDAEAATEFPPECPGCGGDIRLIAFISELGPIRKILAHLGELLEPPPVSPARPTLAEVPLAHLTLFLILAGMSPITKSLIEELEHAPETVQRAVLAFLRHLRARGASSYGSEDVHALLPLAGFADLPDNEGS